MSFVKRKKFATMLLGVLCLLGFIMALEFHWHNHVWSFEHVKYKPQPADVRKSGQIFEFISNFEDTRRHIELVVQDMWCFTLAKLKPLAQYIHSDKSTTFEQLLSQLGDYKR
ncbi:uncharacterized protein LOC111087281 [Limulus polyphemus]|uniref:Uncharacterized protein LOC111087281 n=1 Tax=Limulus polyphemus TaxID=6850 RepID=A0ABM1SZN7_LIMPO|nr:uncharacterized protein LOC111087281 [Limulus polyphemus]